MHGLLCPPPLGAGSTLNPDPAEACKRYILTRGRGVTHRVGGADDKHIHTM